MLRHRTRVERILGKLAALRGRAQQGDETLATTYGATTHRFVLAPSLSEPELVAVEAKLGVALPEAFRAFLAFGGSAGAGPYHGVLPADRWDSALDECLLDFAGRPWSFEPGDEVPARLDTGERFQGAIAVADQGCTFYALLVITGPHRGRIVYINIDGGVPFFCAEPDFLAWYERWVDELSWGHDVFWFGTDLAGDEDALRAAAESGDPALRWRALAAMSRLRRWSDATALVIAKWGREGDAATRKVVLHLYDKNAGPLVRERLQRMLDDPEADVRAGAVRALARCGGAWDSAARRALSDGSRVVAYAALYALIEHKRATVADLTEKMAGTDDELAQLAAGGLAETRAPGALRILLEHVGSARLDLSYPFMLLAREGLGSRAERERALDYLLLRARREGLSSCLIALTAFAREFPAALDALLSGTQHEDGFVRFDAANALGEVVDLSLPNAAVVIATLEQLSRDETMPREATRRTAWSVGEAARRALERIRARAP